MLGNLQPFLFEIFSAILKRAHLVLGIKEVFKKDF